MVSDDKILRSTKVEEVSVQVLPWGALGPRLTEDPVVVPVGNDTGMLHMFQLLDNQINSRPVDTLLSTVLALGYTNVALINCLEYSLPFCRWNEYFAMKDEAILDC